MGERLDIYFSNGEVIIPQLAFKASTNTTDPLPQLLFVQIKPHFEEKIINPQKGILVPLYHARIPTQELFRIMLHEETPRSPLWKELWARLYGSDEDES